MERVDYLTAALPVIWEEPTGTTSPIKPCSISSLARLTDGLAVRGGSGGSRALTMESGSVHLLFGVGREVDLTASVVVDEGKDVVGDALAE